MPPVTAQAPGFRASDLRPGDPYEISGGRAIYCAPTGGDGSRGTLLGAEVLDTDPAVEEAGVDAGFSPAPHDLRAPDVAVGNVPDAPGWIAGAPPLAVEYAGSGQDEPKLREKIRDLLSAGTRWVWVVRLLGERHVEVHEANKPIVRRGVGDVLTAPGVLRNDVPVEALFDRQAAHEVTLRNLLQRRGYESLDAVREEGRDEGLEAGLEAGLSPLVHQLERRLGRRLSDGERRSLAARFPRLGPARLGDVVLDLDPAALAAWLADEDAR
jgi:Uma2 family endonuclease